MTHKTQSRPQNSEAGQRFQACNMSLVYPSSLGRVLARRNVFPVIRIKTPRFSQLFEKSAYRVAPVEVTPGRDVTPVSVRPGMAVPSGRSCMVGCAACAWCMVTINETAGVLPTQTYA